MFELPFPANEVRWSRDTGGHYESFWIKGNAPDRKLGIWLKYNLLAPKGSSQSPVGESWAVLLDGDTGRHLVAKRVVPAAEVELHPPGSVLRLGDASLSEDRAEGSIPAHGGRPAATWRAELDCDEPVLLDFPHSWMYTSFFPKKKNLIPKPKIRLSGSFEIGGEEVSLDGWTGLQGHNWGRGHAFELAYANANHFDQRDDVRFDGYCARVSVGPVTIPRSTGCVLRLGRTTYPFNRIRRSFGKGNIAFPRFSFQLEGDDGYRLGGTIEAPRKEFVGLHYADPDGGLADCLNTKFGRGELLLERKVVGRWEEVQRLTSDVFELEFLLRDVDHGVPMMGGNPFEELNL